MSLFKARDFWSFNLGDLPSQLEAGESRQHAEDEAEPVDGGEFVADLGRFQAINGARHDVLVCANLGGLIFVIQVPESEQSKLVRASSESDQPNGRHDEDNNDGDDDVNGGRQLLLAKQLDTKLIVDIKCGYFSSTTKQSIAVLSKDKLMVFQVKQQTQTIDLVSEPSSASIQFSHSLEEQYRIELIGGEFAQAMVVLSRHAGPEAGHSHHQDRAQSREQGGRQPSGPAATTKRPASICLPQRDSVLVQYTNQLLFSLIEHRRVVGHYRLRPSGGPIDSAGQQQQQQAAAEQQSMWRLAQSTGCMPAAFLVDSLVVSLTDRRLCALPLAKLSSQAKESVVKRVAKNLLASSLSYNSSSAAAGSADQMIELDLDSVSDWQRDLANSPLQLIGGPQAANRLLVVSRYNLDLFSASGQHLWAQRFETALICAQSYTLIASGQLHILLCSDCLSGDKCNLSIMLDDQIVWSALLNTRPAQLWRANLQKMSGLLISLDAIRGQLVASYLGTNNRTDQLDGEEEKQETGPDSCLSQLESLEQSFSSQLQAKLQKQQQQQQPAPEPASLSVRVRLEASNQWPNVHIKCRLAISPAASVGGLLQNITMLMHFDESLQFELSDSGLLLQRHQLQEVAKSALQLQLGNCWPDRREPMLVEGSFSLSSGRPAEQVASGRLIEANQSSVQTRSLRVDLVFRFNEIHSSATVQEESFLLPLSLIGQLTLIDYSSGAHTEASLHDVLANLGPSYPLPDQDQAWASPFKCCDILLQRRSDLLELIDELIEADLVCRGLESRGGGSSSSSAADEQQQLQRRMSTLENVSLLAQSLDCRLRFKSLARPASRPMASAASGDEASPEQQVSMMSIGLRLPLAQPDDLAYSKPPSACERNETGSREASSGLVWLHLLDLRALQEPASAGAPILAEQFVRQHLAQWKWQKLTERVVQSNGGSSKGEENKNRYPILVSIESEHGQAILFMLNHLVERLHLPTVQRQQQLTHLTSLHESQHDSIEVNPKHLLDMSPFLAFSERMHDYLSDLIDWHRIEVKEKSKTVKEDLASEFANFQTATLDSLSLAKRLCDLPDEMQDEFNLLSKTTSQIQLNLTRLLNQMEKLKRLEEMFNRIPVAPVGCQIVLQESGSGQERIIGRV